MSLDWTHGEQEIAASARIRPDGHLARRAQDRSEVPQLREGAPAQADMDRARRASEPSKIGAAVIGYGYWGPNLARNLSERPEFRLRCLCDRDGAQQDAFSRRFPHVQAVGDFANVLRDSSVDAVVIATPPQSHYALARAALLAGKHVLVEKPLATSLVHARELAALAQDRGLVLMPGHTFIYSPAVNAVRDLICGGDVGEVHFVTSSRMNLGKYQADGVVCDLAPHDLSILLYWLGRPVVEVAASGRSVLQRGVPETAFLTLAFDGGTTANVQISWLAPRKVRQMIVVGSKLMVQYDDTAADEPVRVYDRGLDIQAPTSFGEHQLIYRSGDIVIPRVASAEPLGLELADFAQAIRTGQQPRSNVALGVQIVAVMESAARSMRERGAPRPVALQQELLQAA
jgi:predicted dehydrogenase